MKTKKSRDKIRIGVDLGGTKIEAAVLDAKGRRLFRERVPTPKGDYQATLAAVARLVGKIDRRFKTKGAPVGVGTPGAVSPATQLVKNANSTCLIGKPFHKDLETALGRRVRLANDANCFALSEAVDGAAAGAHCVFGVILGTGVGAGIVIKGKVLTGANAIAGEWGHNALPWPQEGELPGFDCYCGRKGCVESFLSGPSIERDYHEATGKVLDCVGISESQDYDGKAAMTRFLRRLSRALAHVINILDPDVIVLGGGVSNIGRIYAEVPGLWGPFVFSDHVATKLVKAKHGDSSGVRGAAWLW